MATVHTTPFDLTGADGGPLRGEVRTAGGGAGRPAVVICHGFKGFKDWGFFPHLAHRIANAGMTAVSFNFSGSGVGPDNESFSEGERFGHATHSNDVRDISIVIDALKSTALPALEAAPSRMGLVGHSRGGGAAILAADRLEVDALVTWASIATVERWPEDVIAQWRRQGSIDIVNSRTGQVLPLYTDLLDEIERDAGGPLDIAAAAGRLRLPWLIVHGDADESVAVADGYRLYAAAAGGGGSGQAELAIVKGGSHTFGAKHPWAGYTDELRVATDQTVAWFVRHML
jgi:uncharacterized protein